MTGSSVAVIRVADRRRVPWKNGAGVTEEIAADTETSRDQPIWRISLADLGTAPSAFSAFDGTDRIFTVVGDREVALEWPSDSDSVAPWHPRAFAGEDPPRCTPAGATSALNVMTDRTAAAATVETIRLGEHPLATLPDEVTALFVRSGTATAESLRAAPGDCVIVRHDAVPLRGDADGLLIRIRMSHGPKP